MCQYSEIKLPHPKQIPEMSTQISHTFMTNIAYAIALTSNLW